MRFSVDRIEEGIVILENILSGEIMEAELEAFDFDVCEGNIVIFIDGKFCLDTAEEKNRREQLRNKLNNLKKSD